MKVKYDVVLSCCKLDSCERSMVLDSLDSIKYNLTIFYDSLIVLSTANHNIAYDAVMA
jgi:hypothetical protein